MEKDTQKQREHYRSTAAEYDTLISEQDEHGLALRYVTAPVQAVWHQERD